MSPIADLISRLGDLSGVERITLRAGVRTGDLLVVVRGRVPDHAAEWGAPVVVTGGGGPRPARRHLREEVAGVRFRVTGTGFFQVNTDGADHLVRLVTDALRPGSDDVLLDAYAGVGLFSATVGSDAGAVVAVERGRSAVRDLERNLRRAGLAGEIVDGSVERELASGLAEAAVTPWTLAVCDPPRAGLGAEAVAGIVATRPRRLAYVSCDPASLARDTRLLAAEGYHLEQATPVDLFPQTFHIETVAAFSREGR